MEALERSIAKANLRPVLTNPATYEALWLKHAYTPAFARKI
jgi:hypothetical protein